jgi:hypothetical protein
MAKEAGTFELNAAAKQASEQAHHALDTYCDCLTAFQEQATVLGMAYTKAVADAVNPLPKAA